MLVDVINKTTQFSFLRYSYCLNPKNTMKTFTRIWLIRDSHSDFWAIVYKNHSIVLVALILRTCIIMYNVQCCPCYLSRTLESTSGKNLRTFQGENHFSRTWKFFKHFQLFKLQSWYNIKNTEINSQNTSVWNLIRLSSSSDMPSPLTPSSSPSFRISNTLCI